MKQDNVDAQATGKQSITKKLKSQDATKSRVLEKERVAKDDTSKEMIVKLKGRLKMNWKLFFC